MIKELVPCGNPAANQLLAGSKRSVPADTFQPSLRMGVKYCAWCNSKPLAKGKRKYCSTACQESCYLCCYPQTDGGAAYLMNTRGCHCAACGFSWIDIVREQQEKAMTRFLKYLDRKDLLQETRNVAMAGIHAIRSGVITGGIVDWTKRELPQIRKIEIDHIIPVALGGTTFGFENLQLLCYECHKAKTKKDMVEIRKSRMEPSE